MSSSDNKPLPAAPTSTPASPTTNKKSTSELDSPKRSKSPNKSKATSSPTKAKSTTPTPIAKENVAGSSANEKEKVVNAGDKKNHNRKGSSRSGGSQSAGKASTKSATTTSKVADGSVTPASEGLSNLKSIISELKDTSTPPAVTGTPSASTSTNTNSRSGKGHKSSGSASKSSSAAAPNVVVSQAPSTSNLNASVSSNLNPNAGGFQPGTLGVISDHMDEAAITPTASQFDLMTGMPSSSRGNGLGGGSFAFPPSPNPSVQQQIQHQQTLAQQQQYLQIQAQQQQFQLQQLALLGYGPGSNASSLMNSTNGNFNPSASMSPALIAGNGSTQTDLIMAEQMAIQQQLEALRLQQASLLTRFSEMQVAAAAAVSSSSSGLIIPQSQSLQSSRSQETGGLGQVAEDSSVHPNRTQSLSGPAGHRRIHSQQDRQGGQMGSFGSFGGGSHNSSGGSGSGFNNLTSSGSNGSRNGNESLGYSNNLPQGHGRRHSVNTLNKSTNGHQSSPSNGGNGNNNGIFGSPLVNHSSLQPAIGLRNTFTFPNNGSNNNNNNNNSSHRSSQSQDLDFGNSNNGGNGSFGHARRQSGSVSSLGGWSMNNNINSSNSTQANLAEAQSHLQQLAAYRASAGHSRVPSFGMSLPGGGPGQLSMSGYGGGITPSNQQNGNGNNNGGGGGNNQMRKSLFAPYLPQASIPPLLAAGKLVIGILRVNKRNRSDAYVTADGLDSDIYVCGSKDRNRALEGDLVAIELLDVDEVWGTKKEKEEKKRKKEENSSNAPFDPRASISSTSTRRLDKKKDEIEVEGQGLLLLEEEEVTDDQKPTFAGHVVAVVERAPGQLFSGMLGVLRPSSAATQQKQDAERREREGVDLKGHGYHTTQQTPKIIWFRPTDKRVPLIAIPTDQAPHDFIDRPENYSDRLFVACIKRWPISSLHPFGTLVEELGVIGDIETETNALLKDCNFSAEDFSDSVLKCLPAVPFVITEQEFGVRRDYRSNRVFTIDPETAKDLDDALHVVKNEDGTFEVGVHIADVTHYVRPNTALDREARKRATTVYLVQRAVPMLPPALSETLCSLTAGEDKLTFSTVFTMSKEGRVLSTWFGKTVINSKVKLAYSNAQDVIDGKGLPDGKVVGDEDIAGVEADILMLADLARQMRARRFETGALRIDNVKVSFGLDENGLPVDCLAFERREANELIEEFMLLANLSVAGKIAAGLPEQALLRRHEPPIDRRLDAFVERMGRLNITLDASSSGALMKSFEKVTDKDERITLQHLSTKSMQRAKYFCTGMLDISKYSHYALNLPLYTHFTSPIRRYADVMVHRQLEAVLAGPNADTKFTLDTEAVAKVAQVCNTKKDAARLAQEQSAHLFLCVLISQLTQQFGPVIRKATVIGVLDAAFDVLVPEFGVEKRCRVDSIPIENSIYEPTSNTLKLFWKKGIDVLSWTAETQNDSHLQQVRSYAEKHAALLGTTSKSHEAEVALFEEDPESSSDESELEEGEIKEVGSEKAKNSLQYKKSKDKSELIFEEIEENGKHFTQIIRELATVPVILTADMTKSPPVIKVLCINPFK